MSILWQIHKKNLRLLFSCDLWWCSILLILPGEESVQEAERTFSGLECSSLNPPSQPDIVTCSWWPEKKKKKRGKHVTCCRLSWVYLSHQSTLHLSNSDSSKYYFRSFYKFGGYIFFAFQHKLQLFQSQNSCLLYFDIPVVI